MVMESSTRRIPCNKAKFKMQFAFTAAQHSDQRKHQKMSVEVVDDRGGTSV